MKGDWFFKAICCKSCHQLLIELTKIFLEGINFLLSQNSWIFEILSGCKIETKVRHNTICPLILSREVWFCLLVQIAQIGTYESIFSQIIAFTLESTNTLQIYYPCDPTTTLIPKTSKTSPVSLAFFYCLTFSLVLWLLMSTFTAFPMFLKVFGCLEHVNNYYIFSILWSKWPERNKINL